MKGDVPMTQPPGGQPPPQEGGFGAPYEPPTGSAQPPPPPPGYGYPPQAPGPYGTQPGPYGPPQPGPYGPPQPGSYGPQPGPYAQPQPGPYGAQPGYGATPPPAAPGGGRSKRRTGLVVGAVLAVLLLAGGGVLFLGGDDGAGGKKPVAGPSDTTSEDGKHEDKDKDKAEPAGPSAAELNAGRKPGEARVLWLKYNDVDLPGLGAAVNGPWTAGDIVARTTYRTVSGYALADGTEKWKLSLPTDVCAAPSLPTDDGKIVIATLVSNTASIPDCSVLQMIDLKTGEQGWKKTVPLNGRLDMRSEVSLAVNGGTVTYARAGGGADGYRISDGEKLFGEAPGECEVGDVASGARLIAGVTCSDAVGKNRIEELDPTTGKPKWAYQLEPGWYLQTVYSFDPPVVVVTNAEEQRIIALRDDGTLRSRIDGPVAAEAVADARTLYLPTGLVYVDSRVTNTIQAYDLDTGKRTWEAESPTGQAMKPLRMEGGKVLAYVLASKEQGGGIVALEPGSGSPQTLLRHPASAADAEDDVLSARVVYVDGRSVLVPPLLASGTDEEERALKTVMVFGQ
ncbi:PQQ-binding-like beta-propeller repeat protein [Streptomyces sp. SID3915]|nr:PQQ-binding-like beta-propeller repeat protein [Streptomyces sp. SID3915]